MQLWFNKKIKLRKKDINSNYSTSNKNFFNGYYKN